jgi:methyl-accepting chemotaxis protein
MTPLDVRDMRERGARLLVIVSWVAVALMALAAALLTDGKALPIATIGTLANLLPSWIVLRGDIDRTGRALLGTLAAVIPALGVYALGGHGWQMDGHMYFFVALAGLTMLCDWRPIVVGSALIALHHLVLQYAAPQWVFSGSGNLGRVLFHAAAVVMQASLLSYCAILIRRLMQRQADARRASEQAAAMAEQAAAMAESRRIEAEAAMAAGARAEQVARKERARNAELRQQAEADRREDMRRLASAFQQDMAAIVDAVGTSARELDDLGRHLLDTARRSSREAAATADNAMQTSANAEHLAARLHGLSGSITAIAASAEQQARRSDDANSISAAGRDAVATLTERSREIAGFADSIHEIATRTNLLALNATIEAARAGDVGRGFAVVATEVKSLAGQAASATEEIRILAGSMGSGAGIARDALNEIAAMVADLATAAESIRESVDVQRESADAIDDTARETALGADAMARQMGETAGIANATEQLSDRVALAAGGLSKAASRLDDATSNFVARIGLA